MLKDDVNLSVALDFLDKKIANLNMQIIKSPSEELEKELDECLNVRKEVYKGNMLLVQEIIDNMKK